MCPHCRAFITTSERVCPYCNEVVGPRAVELRDTESRIGGLIPSSKFTTSIILLINIAIYIATDFMAGGGLLKAIAEKESAAILLQGQWWRLITAGFVHGGMLHILMNMWVLNDLGAEVERVFGTARFLVIYFAATIGGFLLSAYFVRGPSVGASAGLFGLIGAMIAFGIRNRTEVGRQIRAFYIKWAIYGLVMGVLPIFRIDNAAHLGGLAAGIGMAYVAGTPVHSSRVGEQLWRVLAVACVLVTAYAFWIVYVIYTSQRGYVPSAV